jgi:hypothetical protein
VSKDDDFRHCNEDLFGRDCSTSVAESVEDAVDVEEVEPDELANTRVVGQSLIATITSFEARCRSLDATVVDVGPSHMRDFWF